MRTRTATMPSIEAHHFRLLLEHMDAVAPDLLITCRWLACGPIMAPLILGQEITPPSADDLSRLAAQLETAPKEAAAGGRVLLDAHSHLLAELDVALERLVAAPQWAHPTEILGRHYPDLSQLLATCANRLEWENGNRRQPLEATHQKLERAVRLEAKAQKRRDRGR